MSTVASTWQLAGWRRLMLALALVATLGAGLAARPAIQRWVTYTRLALAYAPPLDSQEGFALWEVDRWRAGLGLYVSVEANSFVSAPYPPVHPFVMRLIGSTYGPHVFWGGRMFSLVALIGIGVAGAVLIRRVTGSWLGGIAAGGLLVAQPPFQLWAMRIKPDMLGLCFTVIGLAGVAYFQRVPKPILDVSQRWRGWGHALALATPFAIAHFTKQTLVAGPLAAATLLLLYDRRAAFRFCVALGGLLAVVWAGLDLLTQGQYTYHVWVLHKLGWKYPLWVKLVQLLQPLWPLMLLGVAGIIAMWRRPTIINAYLLWAPLSLLGAGVQGAHHNHLLETNLALCLAGGQGLGLGLQGLRSTLPKVPSQSWLALSAPVLALQWLLVAMPLPWFQYEYTPDPDYGRYIDFIRATPGEILSDDVGLLYAAGRPLRYDDPSAMGPAVKQGLWTETGLLDDIKAQRFSAIIMPHNTDTDGREDTAGHWSPDALQAIADHYRVKFLDTQIIYEPR